MIAPLGIRLHCEISKYVQIGRYRIDPVQISSSMFTDFHWFYTDMCINVVALSLIGITAELMHYRRQARRFHLFENGRYTTISLTDERHALNELVRKNPDLLERIQTGFPPSKYIISQDDIDAALSSDGPALPANRVSQGRSRLFWQYRPLFCSVLFHTVRRMGEWYLQWLGFNRVFHMTTDGCYAVWSHVVPGTRPLLVFPGLGMGAIPYATLISGIKRTVYVIEVPNFGGNAPLSDRQFTAETLCDVVDAYCPDHILDIFAHSFGTCTAATYLNESQDRHGVDMPIQHVVLCDGFVHAVDFVRSNIYPFVDDMDYGYDGRPLLFGLKYAIRDIEFQAWSKRFHNLSHGTLCRKSYPNLRLLYIFGTSDGLYDVPYIRSHVCDSLKEKFVFVEDGMHGDCIFGDRNRRSDVFNMIICGIESGLPL
jgi:hypothetical protein